MERFKYFLAVLAFWASACGVNEQYKTLIEADTLLKHSLVDSAFLLLKCAEPLNEEDSAYFFVLKIETDFRREGVISDFSSINYSINYYTKYPDNRKLANAYYYKSLMFTINGVFNEEALLLLKKAEQLADDTSDNFLKDKICAALVVFNYQANELNDALKYARKEYGYAQTLGCDRDVAYSVIRLSVVFRAFGDKDSSEFYALKCKRLANNVDDEDKSLIYNLLGECFADENKYAALEYFNKALTYKKQPETYRNIADLCFLEKDTVKWRLYCDSALTEAWIDLKFRIFSDMALKYYEMQDYNSYKSVVDSIIKIQNLRYDEAKADKLIEIQNKFDFEKQRAYYEKLIWIFVAVLSILLAVSAIAALLYKRAIYKSRQKMLSLESDNRLLHDNLCHADGQIKEFRAQIEYLTNQNAELNAAGENTRMITESNNTVISELRHKISLLSKETEKSLKVGRTIYEQMEGDASIDGFKERWADCLFYFEVTFPDHTKIFSFYNNLSISNMLFIICDDYLHKDDYQLSSIFSISVSTVRSRRSKLKDKLV